MNSKKAYGKFESQEEWIAYHRVLCDASFFHFVRMVGGYSKQGGIISQHLHFPLCQFAQDPKELRTAIAMPRNWLKSTVFTKWKAIWDYLQDQEHRILIASENERIAGDFLYWIQQQILSNELLRLLYSDVLCYFHPDGTLHPIDRTYTRMFRWSRTAMDLPRIGKYSEPTMRAIGIRGAVQSGHYTIIHIDDLVGEAAMESELVLGDVLRWFDNCYELLVEPDWTQPDASRIEMVGTHWGPGDFFCYVQERYPEFKWRIVPCRRNSSLEDTKNITYLQRDDIQDGESNWGERNTTEYYIDMLSKPDWVNIYWAQHMNTPKEGGTLTKLDVRWFRYYELEERDKGWYLSYHTLTDGKEVLHEYAVSDIPLYAMLDPGGFADKRRLAKGSRNAIVIGGQPKGTNHCFIIHAEAWKFNKDKIDFMDRIFAAHEKWKPRMWRIDTVGSQPYIYYDIITERKKRKIHLPISPIKEDKRKDSKDTDIEALIIPMSNGQFYIHESMKDLKAEVSSYPHGITKDLLDMQAKLFKLYLKRGKKLDTQKINLQHDRYKKQRDPVSGY